jgi:hypothetical protein
MKKKTRTNLKREQLWRWKTSCCETILSSCLLEPVAAVVVEPAKYSPV